MGIDFKRPRHIRGFRLGEVLVWDFTSKPLVEKTVSGSIAHIEDGADTVPLKAWDVTVDANLDGYSEVNGVQRGKNLLDNELTSKTANGTTFTVNADKSITISGTPSATTRVYISRQNISVVSAMFFSFGTMPTGIRVFCSRVVSGATSYPTISPSHTATIDADYTNFLLEVTPSFDGVPFTIYPMLEVGNSSTTYTPYQTPTQYTASLGRTIYGGEVDIVNGTGTEKYKIYTASDVTSLYWNAKKAEQVDTNHRASFRIALPSGYITINNSLCYELSYSTNIASGSGAYEGYQLIATAGIYFCIDLADIGMENATSNTPDQDFLDAIHAYGNNLVICVELATPTDFTFTPITPTPETALGVNNFWADEGNSSVTYYTYAD